jgi:hypothetical protein
VMILFKPLSGIIILMLVASSLDFVIILLNAPTDAKERVRIRKRLTNMLHDRYLTK